MAGTVLETLVLTLNEIKKKSLPCGGCLCVGSWVVGSNNNYIKIENSDINKPINIATQSNIINVSSD